jgi:hypothetical protein
MRDCPVTLREVRSAETLREPSRIAAGAVADTRGVSDAWCINCGDECPWPRCNRRARAAWSGGDPSGDDGEESEPSMKEAEDGREDGERKTLELRVEISEMRWGTRISEGRLAAFGEAVGRR